MDSGKNSDERNAKWNGKTIIMLTYNQCHQNLYQRNLNS